jgi:hypothetical protein
MAGLYGAEIAREVIGRAQVDYRARFGNLERTLDESFRALNGDETE